MLRVVYTVIIDLVEGLNIKCEDKISLGKYEYLEVYGIKV